MLTVPLPIWRRLDRLSAWQEFGDWSKLSVHAAAIKAFQPDLVYGTDWTSVLPYKQLNSHNVLLSSLPFVWHNYRIFHQNADASEEDKLFYRQKEQEACDLATSVVVLCKSDQAVLAATFRLPFSKLSVLHCPLRREMEQLALALPAAVDVEEGEEASTEGEQKRRYITCVVRLLPEKNAALFVDVMVQLAPLLHQRGLVPFLCGSPVDKIYADNLKQKLLAAFPQAVIKEFLSSSELASVFSASLLNFHPTLYEAYGMTIIEAAAFGVITLMHHDSVGAMDRLEEGTDVLLTDMRSSNKAVAVLRDVLDTTNKVDKLKAMGKVARKNALDYNETAFSQLLLQTVEAAVVVKAATTSQQS